MPAVLPRRNAAALLALAEIVTAMLLPVAKNLFPFLVKQSIAFTIRTATVLQTMWESMAAKLTPAVKLNVPASRKDNCQLNVCVGNTPRILFIDFILKKC